MVRWVSTGRCVVLVAVLAVGAPSGWAANGYSTDIELLRPSFSSSGLVGVDSPQVREAGRWRVGLTSQYQHDPLVLYQYEQEVGTIIEHRVGTHLGFVYDAREQLSLRLVLPTYYQVGTDVPELAASGFGAGDLGLGATVRAVELGPVGLGLRIDLTLPTSRDAAWSGEDNLRTGAALLAHLDLGRFDTLVEVGPTLRTDVETSEDFTLGSELNGAVGLRFDLIEDVLSPYVLTLTRTGLSAPFSGGAETPAESVLGVQLRPIEPLLFDLGLGTGWSDGYGTTQERVLVGVTWVGSIPREEKPEPLQAVVVTEPPPEVELPDDPPEPEEEPWREGQLAKVEGERIKIREPIQFEFNTARILPESLPVLYQVAGLLNENARIVHVVVEGHASEEGSFAYNYDLSILRARAIWEQLIRGRVHPNRISYRGMGEVVPRTEGSSEGELADNRRVDFHIVHQLGPLDLTPTYAPLAQLPWNGGDPEGQGELPAVSPSDSILEVEKYTVGSSGEGGHDDLDLGGGDEDLDVDDFDVDYDEEEVDPDLIDEFGRGEIIRAEPSDGDEDEGAGEDEDVIDLEDP